MSVQFHANQFEAGFNARRLGNWQQIKDPVRPKTRVGYTQFIADDRGHLYGEIPRSIIRPFDWYIKTWDLPTAIPGIITSPTALSPEAIAEAKFKRKAWERELTRLWLGDRRGFIPKQFYKGTQLEKVLIPVKHRLATTTRCCPEMFVWEMPNGYAKERSMYLPQPIAPGVALADHPCGIQEKPPKCPKYRSCELCYHYTGIVHPKKYPCGRDIDEDTSFKYNCLAGICPIKGKHFQKPCCGHHRIV